MANKKRLIDANALQLEPTNDVMNGVLFMGRATGRTLQLVRSCLEAMINNAHTVDAVEVVHGRWIIEINEPNYKLAVCSVCRNNAEGIYNYCPHCGAKMDGGNEDV